MEVFLNSGYQKGYPEDTWLVPTSYPKYPQKIPDLYPETHKAVSSKIRDALK